MVHGILVLFCGAAMLYTSTLVVFTPTVSKLNTDFVTLSSTVLLKKIGFFMGSAAVISIIYTLIFFVTILHAIGPLGDCCSLVPVCRMCFEKGTDGQIGMQYS